MLLHLLASCVRWTLLSFDFNTNSSFQQPSFERWRSRVRIPAASYKMAQMIQKWHKWYENWSDDTEMTQMIHKDGSNDTQRWHKWYRNGKNDTEMSQMILKWNEWYWYCTNDTEITQRWHIWYTKMAQMILLTILNSLSEKIWKASFVYIQPTR